ncbi:MAG: hypothetical protein K8E66_10020 [Phycisphaerales bacterium]|nr:hypothetical protein [Phycisphaerales bacterium]
MTARSPNDARTGPSALAALVIKPTEPEITNNAATERTPDKSDMSYTLSISMTRSHGGIRPDLYAPIHRRWQKNRPLYFNRDEINRNHAPTQGFRSGSPAQRRQFSDALPD